MGTQHEIALGRAGWEAGGFWLGLSGEFIFLAGRYVKDVKVLCKTL